MVFLGRNDIIVFSFAWDKLLIDYCVQIIVLK